jgi:hypothetical protein
VNCLSEMREALNLLNWSGLDSMKSGHCSEGQAVESWE